jgi:hypothetical protein
MGKEIYLEENGYEEGIIVKQYEFNLGCLQYIDKLEEV